MEHPGVDDWTRVDPVFNEGTTVEGRVALQLQVMSDRVARVWLVTIIAAPRPWPVSKCLNQAKDASFHSADTGERTTSPCAILNLARDVHSDTSRGVVSLSLILPWAWPKVASLRFVLETQGHVWCQWQPSAGLHATIITPTTPLHIA